MYFFIPVLRCLAMVAGLVCMAAAAFTCSPEFLTMKTLPTDVGNPGTFREFRQVSLPVRTAEVRDGIVVWVESEVTKQAFANLKHNHSCSFQWLPKKEKGTDALEATTEAVGRLFRSASLDPIIEKTSLTKLTRNRQYWHAKGLGDGQSISFTDREKAISEWLNDPVGSFCGRPKKVSTSAESILPHVQLWCTLKANRGAWIKLNHDGPGLLLARAEDVLGQSGALVTAILVHDPLVMRTLIGEKTPNIPGSIEDRPLLVWDFGDPAVEASKKIGHEQSVPSVVFEVTGLPSSLGLGGIPRAEGLIIYPSEDTDLPAVTVLDVSFADAKARAAIANCAGLADHDTCKADPNLSIAAQTLEAFLPQSGSAVEGYKLGTASDALYARIKSQSWNTESVCRTAGSSNSLIIQRDNEYGVFPDDLGPVCAHFDISKNTSLAGFFTKECEQDDLTLANCSYALPIKLTSSASQSCLPTAPGGRRVTLNKTTVPTLVDVVGLSSPMALAGHLKNAETSTHFYVATAEVTLGEYGSFLAAGNRASCDSVTQASWITKRDATSCHPPVGKAPSRSGDDDGKWKKLVFEYDRYRYFYEAVAMTSLSEKGARDGRVAFFDYSDVCLGANPQLSKEDLQLCQLRTFVVSNALAALEGLNEDVGNRLPDAADPIYGEAIAAPKSVCSRESVGVFRPNSQEAALCSQIRLTWEAAMQAGSSTDFGFWDHPMTMVTREDAERFNLWLNGKNDLAGRNAKCLGKSFVLPTSKEFQDVTVDWVAELLRFGDGPISTPAKGLKRTSEKRSFDLRIGMPVFTGQTGIASDAIRMPEAYGQHRVTGLLTGVRERTADGIFGEQASRLGEPILGEPETSWRIPIQSEISADPITGFRPIFRVTEDN